MNHYEEEEAEETLHASIRDVVRGAIETGHLEPQVGAEMSRVLRADARALWSVRVLDAWQWADYGREVWLDRYMGDPELEATVTLNDERGGEEEFTGLTLPAARHAAALAVYASLPEETRKELGECP
jgi:hypothetical protein